MTETETGKLHVEKEEVEGPEKYSPEVIRVETSDLKDTETEISSNADMAKTLQAQRRGEEQE